MYCVLTSVTCPHDRRNGGLVPGKLLEFARFSKKKELCGSVNGDEVSPFVEKQIPWSIIQGFRPETGFPSVCTLPSNIIMHADQCKNIRGISILLSSLIIFYGRHHLQHLHEILDNYLHYRFHFHLHLRLALVTLL